MTAPQPLLTKTQSQPLIGIPFEENGKEVIRYFSEEIQADHAVSNDATKKALELAGAWSDFSPGNYITSPQSNFCAYFTCIASFWNGQGYVMECQDGDYSKSGGIQGSCSHHGGDSRPLYSH
jgi:hypothetical protein